MRLLFPCSFVVCGVGEDVPDVKPAGLAVDLHDEAECVALDIEYLPYVFERSPIRSLRDPVPDIESPGEIALLVFCG